MIPPGKKSGLRELFADEQDRLFPRSNLADVRRVPVPGPVPEIKDGRPVRIQRGEEIRAAFPGRAVFGIMAQRAEEAGVGIGVERGEVGFGSGLFVHCASPWSHPNIRRYPLWINISNGRKITYLV
jgi:hypothetical protein